MALWASVERICEVETVAADARNVKLYNELDVEMAVEADQVAIAQVLLILIDNAIEYGGEGGNVYVRARRRDGRIRVEIEDDGPRIEPKHRSRIFERFYRVDDGRNREMGGTG